jgi:hypothetical protein
VGAAVRRRNSRLGASDAVAEEHGAEREAGEAHAGIDQERAARDAGTAR